MPLQHSGGLTVGYIKEGLPVGYKDLVICIVLLFCGVCFKRSLKICFLKGQLFKSFSKILVLGLKILMSKDLFEKP